MNACILFILLNGSAWATPGCYNGGYMMEPQDVVYTQRLPYNYSTQVSAPPRYWVNNWRPWARSYRNWDGYRFSRQQNQRQGRNWNRGYRQGRRDTRRWNKGYRQGRRDARRVNRRNERRMNKKSRNGNRRGKKNKNKRNNRR